MGRTGTVLTMLIALAGCAHPELTRRHESATWTDAGTGSKPLVDVSTFVLDARTQTTRTTLTSLSERGQAALVEALAAKSDSSKTLLEALGAPMGRRVTGTGLVAYRNTFKRRIVLSTERAGASRHRPEDRIHALRCTFDQLSAETTFRSWNRFSTRYDTVDLGRMSLAQSVGAELGATASSAGGSGDPVERRGGLEMSRDLTEEVSLRRRYVALSGILQDDSATLLQEGAPLGSIWLETRWWTWN